MVRRCSGTLALWGALVIACGDKKDEPDDNGLAGPGGSTAAGSGGRAGGGTGGTIAVGAGGLAGIGAFAGNMIVDPPPTVDLAACAIVKDDGSSEAATECFECCATLDFENDAFFAGECACSMPVDGTGATICASQTTADSCFACCNDADFSGGRFDPSQPGSCDCLHRSNSSICPSSATDPMARNACAVCCINAGYVGSFPAGNTCICSGG